MKLIRFGEAGKEKPGVQLHSGKRIDVSNFCADYTEDFFKNDGLANLQAWITENAENCKEVAGDVRLGPPVLKPSKIVCIGLNYAKHAAESGMEVPKEPVIFFKATSAIVGPNDDLIIPKGSTKTDWEVELGVVIGKKASYVDEADAMNYVAGYVLHNDYSEREYQLERGGQWVKGKSCDTFAPIGPYLVTKDEIEDPHRLDLWLKLNGEIVQKSNTSDFVFDIPQVVSYVSQYMTLLPGDIISTGTPFGVGMGFKPQRYLRPGDVVELGIEGLGTSKQTARAYKE
ncbi:fumarylacetoacetate hydrolase family protein [Salinimicrobium tongyeongense]|uniref:Fumarylacetoacetate hydrolase family protein n=1 Tax=Salinimicrobium tongyeongense TaxID=2809707 RepID=A0ABY6NUT4_9FLAO|nr:fumarylacetoacetate hydrolase family protein [Salinimicrobium tongyeongense]UZH56675.1 fumarylacetoacetate hydrolase family protein [Salinimicrobium tongyeongense]